ncbi:hypothetical protein BC830DRAFT_196606 [Chytriomyces sp. MP71]|nr:hypothetical protein BC830DRAFT_196606 [Chytriomyces sp. MP71]
MGRRHGRRLMPRVCVGRLQYLWCFAGNLPATQAYCSSFSKIQKPSCCNTLPPSKPNFNLMSSLRSSGNEMLKRLNAIVPLMDKPIQQKNDLNNTPASGNQTSPPAPSQGLSTGAIAGIAVGCIALVGAVASIFVVRKRHEIFDVDHPINKALGSRGRPSVKRGASVYKRDRGELSQYRHHLQGEYAPLKATAAPGATASPDVDVIPASSGFSLGGGDRKVILEYTANLPDELSLKVGETVTIVELFDDGWIRGLQQRTNRTGLFPSQCVGLDPPQTV